MTKTDRSKGAKQPAWEGLPMPFPHAAALHFNLCQTALGRRQLGFCGLNWSVERRMSDPASRGKYHKRALTRSAELPLRQYSAVSGIRHLGHQFSCDLLASGETAPILVKSLLPNCHVQDVRQMRLRERNSKEQLSAFGNILCESHNPSLMTPRDGPIYEGDPLA